jgi:hypothetical protein
MASHEQVRERRPYEDLAAILEHATQAGLLKTELPLDQREWVFTLSKDVSLLQVQAVPARAVSIRSSSRFLGVPGRARLLPGRIAIRKPIAFPFISSRSPGSPNRLTPLSLSPSRAGVRRLGASHAHSRLSSPPSGYQSTPSKAQPPPSEPEIALAWCAFSRCSACNHRTRAACRPRIQPHRAIIGTLSRGSTGLSRASLGGMATTGTPCRCTSASPKHVGHLDHGVSNGLRHLPHSIHTDHGTRLDRQSSVLRCGERCQYCGR